MTFNRCCAFTGHRPKKFPWGYDETDAIRLFNYTALHQSQLLFFGLHVHFKPIVNINIPNNIINIIVAKF